MKQIKDLTIILGFVIFSLISINAHYDCASPVVIPSFPFTPGTLTTSSDGPSYNASSFCGENIGYNERHYIFKYSPIVDESISIYMEHDKFAEVGGVYISTDCGQPPSACVEYVENSLGSLEAFFIAEAGQDYFIFVGTETTDNFNIEITKEDVVGVAINKSEPTQALDVNGSIRIGEGTTAPFEGTIRWNDASKEFEGYNGTKWLSLNASNNPGQWGSLPTNNMAPDEKLTAADGQSDDLFGTSVSISGDYAIVGGDLDDVGSNANQGSAYVFHRNGTSWDQQAMLTAEDGQVFDRFGTSVSISGDYAIVGANRDEVGSNTDQGSAYVFHRNGTSWDQQAMLTANLGQSGDQFGISVSISGDYAIIGAYLDDVGSNVDEGSAYVFHRNGTSWDQKAMLTADFGQSSDRFRTSVSISGYYAIVGANRDNVGSNTNQGSAYVFHRDGTSWVQEAMLTAADGQSDDRFGTSVSISSDYAIIGAIGSNSFQGSAYVFHRNGASWDQEAMLTAGDGQSDDQFGISVSISGDNAIIGVNRDNVGSNTNQGSAYVFHRNGTSWDQEAKLTADDGQSGDNFGGSVSISSDYAIIGAVGDDVGSNTDQGSAHIVVKK